MNMLPLLTFVLGSSLLAQQGRPIKPIVIEPTFSKNNPITISVNGLEIPTALLVPSWDNSKKCFSDVVCFVSSWIYGNGTTDKQRLLALWHSSEKEAMGQYLANKPEVLNRNAAAFKNTKRWFFLGWINYGDARIVLLVREGGTNTKTTYTLPLLLDDGQWKQTNSLSTDSTGMSLVDFVAEKLMREHLADMK